MSLPVLKTPTYKMKLHSTGKELEYRPFLVGEEKILWMALESEDSNEIIQALRDVIKACTNGNIDIASLPDFDLINIFINLRCKSVGETIDVQIRSKVNDDQQEGGKVQYVPVTVDLSKAEIVTDPKHSDNFMLDDEFGVQMKYPTFEDVEKFSNIETNDYDLAIEIIKACLVSVYDNNGQVHKVSEASDKELMAFIDSLSKAHLEKIVEFFNTMPKVVIKTEYIDTLNNNSKEELVLEGMDSFFI